MINPSDLRKGNIVGTRPGNTGPKYYRQVIMIEAVGVWLEDWPPMPPERQLDGLVEAADLNPVSLTPEMMTALGFHLIDKTDETSAWIIRKGANGDQTFMCVIKGGGAHEAVELNYLHELQNAFTDMRFEFEVPLNILK